MSSLSIVRLSYLEAEPPQYPERCIAVVFSDKVVISAVASGIEALMTQPLMEPYQDLLGNLILNELEHWFAGKNPALTQKLLL